MTEFADRIIAGEWKGRKLILPHSESVRPTRNRVRQAAFNLLTARVDWEGVSVVDLCCGSGAWGLEALSRGAKVAYLIDLDVKVAAKNVEALKANAEVVRGDVKAWRPPAPVDVVLADPPYDSRLAGKLVENAAAYGKPGSWWCVETAVGEIVEWDGFEAVEYRDYGVSRIWCARQA